MSRPPSFQFYPRDFLTDPNVVLMTPEERGGYIALLCHAWLSSTPGTLPNDDAALATFSGLGDRWPAVRHRIAACFILHEDKWVQKRLELERREQQERSAKMSRLAKSKAHKRAVAERNGSDTPQTPQASTHSPASASASASAEDLESKAFHPPASVFHPPPLTGPSTVRARGEGGRDVALGTARALSPVGGKAGGETPGGENISLTLNPQSQHPNPNGNIIFQIHEAAL